MSELKRLMDTLCPDGVEYKELGEIANKIIDGSHNPPKESTDGIFPMISAKNINQGKIDFIDARMLSEKAFVEENKRTNVQKDDVLLTIVGAIGRCAVVPDDTPMVFQRSVCVIKPKKEELNSKFLLYALESSSLQNVMVQRANGAAQKGIYLQQVAKLKIPVPPLAVQSEIVRLLDNFTALTAALTAELAARKTQYEFYRDQLLTFPAPAGDTALASKQSKQASKQARISDGVRWLRLGDIGSVSMCKRILKSETNTIEGVPFYKIGTFGGKADAYISKEIFEKYRMEYPYPKKGDILISAAGTIGRTVIFDGEPAYFQDSNIVWIENDESQVLNKYLYYFYQMKPWKASIGGTISRLYNDDIRKTKIPVPPLAEQERIVAILDRFDALTNDISKGLPAEIAARQKQYEYYRDRLFTFKEKRA